MRATFAALALLLVAGAARAQTPAPGDSVAPADSSLHRFLDTLADSTDAYFGLSASAPDTAGLDSTLTARLEQPWRGARARRRLGWGPRFAFNRVDGSTWGAGVGFNDRTARFRVAGDASYAAGSKRWLGGGEISAWTRRGDLSARLSLAGGWRTASMDRDHDEPVFATLRALLDGGDRRHYLHREGFVAGADLWRTAWSAGLRYRDRVEWPLAVTTHWDLLGDPLAQPLNLPAAAGRTREIGAQATLRWPFLPLRSAVAHDLSSRSFGSDFEYQRTRVALGGEFPLMHAMSLLPQLVYGRLSGDPVPQASFYLGGARSLRSLPSYALGGSGMALARLELISSDDLLALARIPHPAMFPLQGGLFAATGAVWGPDPFGGPGTLDRDWPERTAWLSEAGVSLLYRPGVPDDQGYLRFDHAWPLGPDERSARWSISYTRVLDLLPAF